MENNHYGFVLVINGKYWSHICQSQSQAHKISYFVRTGAVGPKQTEKLLFYVTKRMQVLGAADFVERIVGDREDLWEKFGAESFFSSADEYRAFAGASRKMTFIHFKNLTDYPNPKPKNDVTKVFGSLVWLRPRYVSTDKVELLDGSYQ